MNGYTINKKANVGRNGVYFEPETSWYQVKLKKNLISELKVMSCIISINGYWFLTYYGWLYLLSFSHFTCLLAFIDIHGHFSFTNYEQVFSTRYLKMFIDSIWHAALITMITLIISYPAAYFISYSRFQNILLM